MPTRNRTSTITHSVPIVLVALAVGSGAAFAHGTGGAPSHAGSGAAASSRARAPSAMTPRTQSQSAASRGSTGTSSAMGTSGGNTLATTTSPITPPPNFSAACEGEVSANCEATAESRFTVSNGDQDPVWSAPVATTVPPTPPADPINEAQDTTSQNFEQSGGGSGVAITEGGGPTLADCMALWEPAVHMTKELWKNVCIRTMNGINEPQVALDSVDPGAAASHRPKHARRVAGN